MYLKEKLIKFLKAKNLVFNIVGWSQIFASLYVVVSLFVYYIDDLDVAVKAKATGPSITWIIIGLILVTVTAISNKLIEKAMLYSSFFELDLDGYVSYSDLGSIMNKKDSYIRLNLSIVKPLYMKGFEIDNKMAQPIILAAKKYQCQCRNCGAIIEKKAYFSGNCSYCGSLDLDARVLTNDRFYNISSDASSVKSNPEYYRTKGFQGKRVFNILGFVLTGSCMLINLVYSIDMLTKYNNKEYMKNKLLSGEGPSYDLINKETIDSFIFGATFFIGFLIAFIFIAKKTIAMGITQSGSCCFAEAKK